MSVLVDTPLDSPAPGTFEAIYQALDASSQPQIGPVLPRLLVIPIRDDDGSVTEAFGATPPFSGCTCRCCSFLSRYADTASVRH